ncbi:MAG: hypothetical protein AB2448_09355 [Moorella sp. (in: firmicutes)]
MDGKLPDTLSAFALDGKDLARDLQQHLAEGAGEQKFLPATFHPGDALQRGRILDGGPFLQRNAGQLPGFERASLGLPLPVG